MHSPRFLFSKTIGVDDRIGLEFGTPRLLALLPPFGKIMGRPLLTETVAAVVVSISDQRLSVESVSVSSCSTSEACAKTHVIGRT